MLKIFSDEETVEGLFKTEEGEQINQKNITPFSLVAEPTSFPAFVLVIHRSKLSCINDIKKRNSLRSI
jgi:hypothetical protein